MTATKQAVIIQGEDSPEVQALVRALQAHAISSGHVVLDDGEELTLPASVTAALHHLVDYLGRGEEVTIGLADRGYTATEAADLLGIFHPYVLQLLESSELPHRLVAGEPRIAHDDLMAYRAKLRERRLQGVREIQRLSEEEGAYDRR